MAEQQVTRPQVYTIYVCPEDGCRRVLGFHDPVSGVPYYGPCPEHPGAQSSSPSPGIHGYSVETVEVVGRSVADALADAAEPEAEALDGSYSMDLRAALANYREATRG